jgi:hypothetical protein
MSLGSAGVANASCASISGISAGTSGGSTCTSTATSFAVGLGNGTDAAASGLFDGSVAIGTGAEASTQGNFNLALAAGTGAEAQAGSTSADTLNVAAAIGTNAEALSEGTGNLAAAIGNTANNGLMVGQQTVVNPLPNHGATAEALGSFNRAFTLGDGSTSTAVGGAIIGTPTLTSIGNNTAITVGKGANSYAGTIPTTPGSDSPSNQFAFAGPGKNAVNAVNP